MSEWHDVTLADISDQRKGINYKSEYYCDEGSGHPFITIKCFVKGGGYQPKGIKFFDGPFTPQDKLAAGDILISVTDLTRAGDIVGSPLKVPEFGYEHCALASMDCMKIAPKEDICNSQFLYFRLMLPDIRRQMVAYSAGSTVLHLDTKKVPSMKIRIPKDVGHQEKLATVLQLLDEAIEQTEALIEKYSLVKAGMMHDLFTRGLTPDGKLRSRREEAPELYKETPIGWIPKEWGLTTVRDCGDVKLGRQRSPDKHTGKWTMPYLRVANVFDGHFDLSDVLEMDFTPSERETFSVNWGDIFLNEGQSLELVGRCAMYQGEEGVFCFQNTLVRFRAYESGHAPFYKHLFKYFFDTERFSAIASQTTSVAHLGADRFAKLDCPLVETDEQELISRVLDALDSKAENESAKLGKLRAQKSGLMHDLLTGEVQVKVGQQEAVHV